MFFPPLIGTFYLIDRDLFVDYQKTEGVNEEYLVPRDGMPKWWATFYAVNSVLWFDYTYLDIEAPLRIEFAQFIQIFFWSFW